MPDRAAPCRQRPAWFIIPGMKRLILLLFSLSLLTACAPSGPGTRSETGIDGGRIERMLARGDYTEAALAFEQQALSRPLDADRLWLRAAEAWLEAARLDQAEKTLRRIDTA